jgi:outer membrane lipoprotein-sorting protein
MNRLLLVFSIAASVFSLHADTAEAVLARMDKAAPTFKAMSANVQMVSHTAVLNDNAVDKGTFKMQKLKGKDVRAIMDLSTNGGRIIGFFGKIVRIYYPNLNSYQDYQVGKESNLLNQYLLLGFGSSGKELAQSYSITAEGEETVEGEPTTKLLLVPKDQAVLEHLAKVEIWVPDTRAYPIQQEFYEPSGNWRKVTYSDIELNPPMKGVLEMKLPPGATKQ